MSEFVPDPVKGFRNHKHERKFKGSPEDYIRLRAKKHKNGYNDPKQAEVLFDLADEVEALRKIAKKAMSNQQSNEKDTGMGIQKSDQIDKLAAALAKFQKDMPSVERSKTVSVKTSKGGSYSFDYAPLDKIIEQATPHLSKHGLAVTQWIEDGGKVTTILLHESGQYISGDITVKPVTNRPQDLGSAITYARRYSYSSVLGIAADDDDDGNGASGNDYSYGKKNGKSATDNDNEKDKPWLNKDTPEWEKTVAKLKAGQVDTGTVYQHFKVNRKNRKELEKAEQASSGKATAKGSKAGSNKINDAEKKWLIKSLNVLPKEHPLREEDVAGIDQDRFADLAEFLKLYRDVRKGLGQMNKAGTLTGKIYKELVERLRTAEKLMDLDIIIDDMKIYTSEDGEVEANGDKDAREIYGNTITPDQRTQIRDNLGFLQDRERVLEITDLINDGLKVVTYDEAEEIIEEIEEVKKSHVEA